MALRPRPPYVSRLVELLLEMDRQMARLADKRHIQAQFEFALDFSYLIGATYRGRDLTQRRTTLWDYWVAHMKTNPQPPAEAHDHTLRHVLDRTWNLPERADTIWSDDAYAHLGFKNYGDVTHLLGLFVATDIAIRMYTDNDKFDDEKFKLGGTIFCLGMFGSEISLRRFVPGFDTHREKADILDDREAYIAHILSMQANIDRVMRGQDDESGTVLQKTIEQWHDLSW